MSYAVSAIVEAIGIPASEWKGRCHEISGLIVKSGLVSGKAVYGKYKGYIAPTSMFSGSAVFARHGWIESSSGTIFDATRWVFEDVEPYVFVAEVGHEDYDPSSLEFSKRVSGSLTRPFPENSPNEKQIPIDGDAAMIVAELAGLESIPDVIGFAQAMWVAIYPYDQLSEDDLSKMHQWLMTNKLNALIPVDFINATKKCT